jgi:drug/metabolite transporter (DMT)-like permease
MTWVANVLAVLASISYGAADFLGGLATKRGSTVFSVVVCSQATGLVLVLLALPFLPPASPTAADLAWGAATGLAGGIGIAFLYRGLAVGVMSVVAPVTAVCAVIIPVVVGLALGERPTMRATAGVALALVAIVLISQSGEVEEGKRDRADRVRLRPKPLQIRHLAASPKKIRPPCRSR